MADRTLLLVAGATPQIVAETVFALLGDPPARTDVHVLTTVTGRDAILRRLLVRDGPWTALRRAYPAARAFRFPRRHITVLRDARGAPMRDVRSAADSVAAADQIVRRVAELTADDAPPLHASIAGGRKTMGYLLAAAMMLHGRPGDRLSHVLVHPPELEGTDFFFPPRQAGGAVTHRLPDGRRVRVAARDIRIELADLPFLRLRGLRGGETLRRASFSDLVATLQADLDALTAPRVRLLRASGALLCAGRQVPLSPLRFAIYDLLAERRRHGCGRGDCRGCPRCFVPVADLGEPVRRALRAALRRRGSIAVGERWNERNFRPEVRKINAALERVLRGAAAPYAVRVTGPRRARLYGLTLPPHAIQAEPEGGDANIAG